MLLPLTLKVRSSAFIPLVLNVIWDHHERIEFHCLVRFLESSQLQPQPGAKCAIDLAPARIMVKNAEHCQGGRSMTGPFYGVYTADENP